MTEENEMRVAHVSEMLSSAIDLVQKGNITEARYHADGAVLILASMQLSRGKPYPAPVPHPDYEKAKREEGRGFY